MEYIEIGIKHSDKPMATPVTVIVNEHAGQEYITLPDGTEIYLNGWFLASEEEIDEIDQLVEDLEEAQGSVARLERVINTVLSRMQEILNIVGSVT